MSAMAVLVVAPNVLASSSTVLPVSRALAGQPAAAASTLVAPEVPVGVVEALYAALREQPETNPVSAEDAGELISLASSSGLQCAGGDVSCWRRVASLGGVDAVILVVDGDVILAGPRFGPSPRRTPLLTDTAPGVSAALRRLLGLEGALRVRVSPETAVVVVDRRQVERLVDGGLGIAEGVGAGAHEVVASAPGFVTASTTASLAPGAVADIVLTLEPLVAVEEGGGLGPILLWSGLGVAVAGIGAGAALGGIGWQLEECSFAGGGGTGKCLGSGGKDAADTWALSGVVLGAASTLFGGAMVTAGLISE